MVSDSQERNHSRSQQGIEDSQAIFSGRILACNPSAEAGVSVFEQTTPLACEEVSIQAKTCGHATSDSICAHPVLPKAAGSLGKWVCEEMQDACQKHKQTPLGAGRATAASLLKKLKLQGFRCALSGRELTEENLTIDHIQPQSRGGSHELDNLHFTDKEINRMKGAMELEQFIAACVEVAMTNGFKVTKS